VVTAPPTGAWSQDPKELAVAAGVDLAAGLTPEQVVERAQRYGPNALRHLEVQSAWEILLNQLKSMIVALLLAACLVSLAMGDWIEAAAIAAVLLINTAIGFGTELRAVRSMEALRELGEVLARVLRGGEELMIPAQELVPGDVVILEGGDVVTADLRVLEASKLSADESILTGESLPIRKDSGVLGADTPLADRRNMLFKGTALTRGAGVGLVVSTGMGTELGRIAALVADVDDKATPLQERLELLGRRLVFVALGIAILASIGGILSGKDAVLMIETGIALAVAAIPEGLPIVATMALARGMWRLSRRNALIRKLSAVETLGETSLILTDKTGTLTENRMTVTRVVLAEGETIEVGPQGSFERGGQRLEPEGSLREALEVCVLCNNAALGKGEGQESLGDPLEVALLGLAHKGRLGREELLSAWPEVREVAFDPALKMMATFHRGEGTLRVAVKGAAEAVLEASTRELREGGSALLDDERRAWWLEQNRALAAQGLRVLAVATKVADSEDEAAYQGLSLIGLTAMEDPPREGVRAAISACRKAGIRVVMATGDQAPTAQNVGLAVGLVDDAQAPVVTGAELAELLQDPQRLQGSTVFARVDPEQKLSLVSAFQRAGEVVAMTGDGVNDAPALQKSDIGVAMGQRGTQVAREAADMVLRDDSLDSIVVAIQQGRVIFENIRQFVLYLLSCNMAEIGVIGVAGLLGLPLPLLPLQILFLNLLTDVFPALALGFGEGDPQIMDRKPRQPDEPFLTRGHWIDIVGYAALLTAVVLGALWVALGPLGYDRSQGVTVSFLTLGFAQLWHVFNMRSRGTTFLGNDVIRNPHVWGSLALCSVLLLAGAFLKPLAAVLGVSPLDSRGWGLVLGFSLIPWVLGQVIHALRGGVEPA